MLALTFQIGDNRLALDIRRVREVVPRVELSRAANAPAWLAGELVYRGRPVPVLDLHAMLGAGQCPAHLSSRIILVPNGDGLLGLLAAQVADIRDIEPGPASAVAGTLGQAVVDGGGLLHLLDLPRILPAPARALLAEDAP